MQYVTRFSGSRDSSFVINQFFGRPGERCGRYAAKVHFPSLSNNHPRRRPNRRTSQARTISRIFATNQS